MPVLLTKIEGRGNGIKTGEQQQASPFRARRLTPSHRAPRPPRSDSQHERRRARAQPPRVLPHQVPRRRARRAGDLQRRDRALHRHGRARHAPGDGADRQLHRQVCAVPGVQEPRDGADRDQGRVRDCRLQGLRQAVKHRHAPQAHHVHHQAPAQEQEEQQGQEGRGWSGRHRWAAGHGGGRVGRRAHKEDRGGCGRGPQQ